MSADIHLSPFETTLDSIDNYLVPALLTTLFCCMPFGVVALVYSGKVNAAKEEEDLELAIEASRKARFWYRTSIFVSLAVNALVLFAQMLVGLSFLLQYLLKT